MNEPWRIRCGFCHREWFQVPPFGLPEGWTEVIPPHLERSEEPQRARAAFAKLGLDVSPMPIPRCGDCTKKASE